jgi:hypothetical protein
MANFPSISPIKLNYDGEGVKHWTKENYIIIIGANESLIGGSLPAPAALPPGAAASPGQYMGRCKRGPIHASTWLGPGFYRIGIFQQAGFQQVF